MTHVERSEWLPDTYAQALELCELLRVPEKGADPETRVFAGEVIRVLHTQAGYHLTMNFQGTMGWIPRQCVSIRPALRSFSR